MQGQGLADFLGVSRGDSIAFVGAGGKTSAMFRMAAELGRRFRVLCSTTTHLSSRETLPSTVRIGPGADLSGIEGACLSAWACKEACLVTGVETAPGKVGSPPASILRKLVSAADVSLLESDGSRGKPVKIPAAHEPDVPEFANKTLVVFGADSFGAAVSDGNFFNLEAACKSGIIARGDILGPEAFGIVARRGGYYMLGGRMPLFLLVNKADACGADAAEAYARAAYSPLLGGVAVSSLREPGAFVRIIDNSKDRMACVILAAGESKRFGSPKLAAGFGRGTLLGAVLRNARSSGFDSIFLVVGHQADMLLLSLGEAALNGVEIVRNPAFRSGMGSSVRAGIEAVESRGFDSAAIMLGDKPLAGPETIGPVLHAYRRSAASICAAVCSGTPGHPAVFRKRFFADLKVIPGDRGARGIMEANCDRVLAVDVDPSTQQDVDVRDDLERLGGSK